MEDTLNKDIQDLRNQQFKRNLVVSSFSIAGGIAGFLIARSYKSKTWIKIASILLGATILGLPVMLITRKKYEQRKKTIKEKSDLTIKVTEGKINIKPNVLTATNQTKIETIIKNIEIANEKPFTKQERPRIEEYFSKLNDEDLTTWVKLSQTLTDNKLITLTENQREKYIKDKYGLDTKKIGELLMKYMDFVLNVPETENINTKQV